MLVAAFAVLAVIVAAILWTPIDLSLAAGREPELRLQLRVSWLHGLVSKEFHRGRHESRPALTETSPPKVKSSGGRSLSRTHSIVRSEGFLPGVVRLLRRLEAGIDVRRAELWARAGFDDPADTGRFLAILFPFTCYLQASSCCRVELEPDFCEQVFYFRARTDVRVVPSRIIGPAVAFALSPATLRAIRASRA